MWKETQMKKLKGAYVDMKKGHGEKYSRKRLILKEPENREGRAGKSIWHTRETGTRLLTRLGNSTFGCGSL